MTLPLHHNFGGIMQAVALQNYLKKLGHETCIIHRIESSENTPFKRKIRNFIYKNILEVKTRAFISKNLVPSTNVISRDEEMMKVVDSYKLDAVITGSDQVWRLEYSCTIALNFFLDFVNQKGVKKISYAASFGLDSWNHPEKITSEISDLLKKFDAVSVREDSGVDICRNSFGVSAVQMIDPTLLLDQADYLQLISNERHESKKKILTSYILDSDKTKENIINKLLLKMDATLVSTNVKSKFTLGKIFNIQDCVFPEVSNWILGFHRADYVVTDSFHGVIFSIIFNKPFFAIGNPKRGLARFQSLLAMFELSDRLLFDVKDLTEKLIAQPIDFIKVNKILQEKRELASTFISNSLANS